MPGSTPQIVRTLTTRSMDSVTSETVGRYSDTSALNLAYWTASAGAAQAAASLEGSVRLQEGSLMGTAVSCAGSPKCIPRELVCAKVDIGDRRESAFPIARAIKFGSKTVVNAKVIISTLKGNVSNALNFQNQIKIKLNAFASQIMRE